MSAAAPAEPNRSPGLYGEPLQPVEGVARSRCADHEWLMTLSDGARAVVLRDRARRAEACINACEGIANPAAASALLREVAFNSPAGTDSYEDPVCWYCGVDYRAGGEHAIEHLETCLWARIRRVLGMDVPPATPATPPEAQEVEREEGLLFSEVRCAGCGRPPRDGETIMRDGSGGFRCSRPKCAAAEQEVADA